MSNDSATAKGTTRRALLAGAIAGCALAALPALPTTRTLIAQVRTLLARSTGVGDVQVELARHVLFGRADIVQSIDTLTDAEIAARVRDNIAADYRAGRVVNLHGWRIASTESHALALLRHARQA